MDTAPVDTERLVRELLGAFDSLKTMSRPLTCSSPSESEQQQPPKSQEGRSKPSELVGGTLSITSADPCLVATTPVEVLTGMVSDIEGEPEQIAAFEGDESSETPDRQIEAQSSQHDIIEEFRNDHQVIERLRVTPQELDALSSASLLGSLTCKQDLLFILGQIREARKRANLQVTDLPEPLQVPGKKVEPPIPDFSEMAERIRRDALAKLLESDSWTGSNARSPLRQFGVFSSALVLLAAMTWSCVKLMLNWWHHLSSKLALPGSSFIERAARLGKTGDSKTLLGGEILLVASVALAIFLRRSKSLTRGSGSI